MNYFRDVSALHDVLGVLYEKAPPEARRAELSRLLEEMGVYPGPSVALCFDRALPERRGLC
jgi:hypothetical protein